MKASLKPLDEQVMVITGASSGIGLATAEAAAKAGAKLVLACRSEQTLQAICERFKAAGRQAIAVTCDVGKREDLEKVAEAAIGRFGRIDTWVNNAGVSIFGRLDQVSEADSRKLFDTNFWGVVNGSLIALPYIKQSGGAIINLGSEVSEAVAPLQAMYSASKHAVKGFTDGLRIEICDVDKTEIAITLIQPTAVDTPYPQHAKNYMDKEAKLPTPVIEPDQVADAILSAAVKPTPYTKVGLMAKINTATSKFLPSLGEKMAAKQADRQQHDMPPINPEGALWHAGGTGETHGNPSSADA